MALVPGTSLGPYQITALIGEGGMGEVYRATDTRLARNVAIKVLPAGVVEDPERLARFEREARILASLTHPHIAVVHGFEKLEGVHALVMELVEGPTLADRIRQGPVPIDEALPIAEQISDALQAAHDQGVVHRDLKPANIKVRPDGTVKVLDFGLAKLAGTPASGSDATAAPTLTSPASLTAHGALLGTAAYMSPEQVKGQTVDSRSDIWAFGVVLYEMVSGRRLFDRPSIAETLSSILRDDPDLTHIPQQLRRLLRALLERDRRKRLKAVGDWQLLMEDVRSGVVAPRSRRDLVTAWSVAGAAVLAAAIAFYAYLRRDDVAITPLSATILLPVGESVHSFAVAPNGRYLVLAAGTGRQRELWLRPLDTGEWQVIPSTRGAQYPFWSPNSQSLGFASDGVLKRMSIPGGTPQTVCVCNAERGSWGTNGTIVFATTTGEIRRVSEQGGAPSEPLRTGANAPVALPAGESFLYGGGPSGGAGRIDGNVYRWSRTKPDEPILSNVSSYVWTPGYILFTREGTLFAQTFDDARGVTGEPFHVADRVTFSPRGPYTPMVVSPVGTLVHLTEAAQPSELQWVDRSGRPIPSLSSFPGRTPSISQDGAQVAFARDADGTNVNVWVREVKRGVDTIVTTESSIENVPFWSPAGDRLIFRLARRLGGAAEVFLTDISRKEPARVLSPGTNLIPTQWSGDGKWIVVVQSDPVTQWDIWVAPAPGSDNGAQPMKFFGTEAYEFQGQLSPDSKWMAYTSDESGQREVYVRRFPSGDGITRISEGGGAQARWRRDMTELYYVTPEGSMVAVAIKATSGPSDTLEVGAPADLFRTRLYDGGLAYEYDVTHDGSRFLVNTNVAASNTSPLTLVTDWTRRIRQ